MNWSGQRESSPPLSIGNAAHWPLCYARMKLTNEMVEARRIELAIYWLQANRPSIERRPHLLITGRFSPHRRGSIRLAARSVFIVDQHPRCASHLNKTPPGSSLAGFGAFATWLWRAYPPRRTP